MSVSETANLEDENSVGYQELYNSVTDFVSIFPLSHL